MHDAKCDRCRAPLPANGYYVARIEVFADPTVPELSIDGSDDSSFSQTIDSILQEMANWSTEELEAQVYKRFDFRLCAPCQRLFVRDPLGNMRPRPSGSN